MKGNPVAQMEQSKAFFNKEEHRYSDPFGEGEESGCDPSETSEGQSEAAQLDSMSAEERIYVLLNSQLRYRDLFLRAIAFCAEERNRNDVMLFIAEQPEMRNSIYEPWALINSLIDCGALMQSTVAAVADPAVEVESAANAGTEAVAPAPATNVQATETALQVVRMLEPNKRFASLLRSHPQRETVYHAILNECEEGKSLADLTSWLQEWGSANQVDDLLGIDFYLDSLRQAGMLVWNSKWKVTEEGRRSLSSNR